MFFFQDDIGLLIQLQNIPFLQFLITPQAEHFVPILHIFTGIEYRLFGLHFFWYVIVIIFIHIFNCAVIFGIVRKITGSVFLSLIALSFFAISLTYTEPFLWFAAHGVVLATLFLGIAFYLWYKFCFDNKWKYFLWSVVFIILSGFSYGVGVAAAVIFAFATFIYKRKIKKKLFVPAITIYAIVGILSYFIGPLIAHDKLDRMTPFISNWAEDALLYAAFIISGVARGVVGRIFLPGFEPRHFEIILTIISFIPFVLIIIAIIWLLIKDKRIKDKLLFIVLSVFVIYPYIWAGLLRFHFGLKQALAERYAYPSIFFFSILITVIFQQLLNKRLIKSNKLLVLFSTVIVILQTIIFCKNAVIFEDRPVKTKKYFSDLSLIFKSNDTVLDLVLPYYINQEYRISDLKEVVNGGNYPRFIKPGKSFCTRQLRRELDKKEIYNFYAGQATDKFVQKELNTSMLENCLNQR